MTETLPTPSTPQEQDAELSRIFALLVAFKSNTLRTVACAVLKRGMECEELWPDDSQVVKMVQSLGVDDRNVVGNAYRWLRKVGLLERTQLRRPSTAASSNGREITCWRVADRRLAETFLKRQAAAYVPDQADFYQTAKG